ncbi:UvrD-helicase domain-containing protein [Halomonas piscis]|uniref:UvrD-helicase domain-containing protein n=1 Tax=Halomonas piscis TaxID=3031727 RepID=UPI0028A0CA42|nr:UvrD-helicase domain-containing protein [Halomonas piscis]
MSKRIQTEADEKVAACLNEQRSFAVIAGAGSGKTSSLIDALNLVRANYGVELRKNGQRVACITYTKRAVEVISTRLGFDDLFAVSTLHSFLWREIKTFTKDIRNALRESRIPHLIAKEAEKDNGGKSKAARKAREKIAKLTEELEELDKVTSFRYEDTVYSNYSKGKLSHDDVIEVVGYLLVDKEVFRKAFGFRYPFIFVDEAQDTFPIIVDAFNAVTEDDGLPVVGYFGDPWQQIYDKRASDFRPPLGGETIEKTENFRCSESVIAFLNVFRKDVEQYPAGDNKRRQGSVKITLVEAEEPEAPRRRYSDAQLDRALHRMDQALEDWGWEGRGDVIRLFLARQMIARRLGFACLNSLFTGKYASTTAQVDYESGEHFLLKPIVTAIWPLIEAHRNGDQRQVVDLLRTIGPAFDVRGKNQDRSLKEMVELSRQTVTRLDEVWANYTLRDVYEYCQENELIRISERLSEHLARAPRTEVYNEEIFGLEKGDWLCDDFLAMKTTELGAYCNFIQENTVYSTQHGVKGEEYSDVLVVFDDIEAAWNNYSFSKLLTPGTSGEPTEGQYRRSEKLAYVCFSRAEENLRILFYTNNAVAAKQELIQQELFSETDIGVIA